MIQRREMESGDRSGVRRYEAANRPGFSRSVVFVLENSARLL